MPTDVLLAIEQRVAVEKREAADLLAILLLVPLVACLFSILLSVQSQAFESALFAFNFE